MFVELICNVLRHRAKPHKGQPKVVKDQFFGVITHRSIFFGIPVGQCMNRTKKVTTQRIKKKQVLFLHLILQKV